LIETSLPIRKALVSVSHKSGLEALCRTLHQRGTALYSTGGTGRALSAWGIPFIPMEDLTQTPEFLGGRVKTLHPKVFGGILRRQDHPSDLEEIAQYGISCFDLVVVNLYPFHEHLHESIELQTEFIDIGGSALIRAAAKNHRWVTVLSDPSEYQDFLDKTGADNSTDASFRFSVAQRSFLRTSQYDRLIYEQWTGSSFPSHLNLTPQRDLRYGENPHQKAVYCGSPSWEILNGKELSYNNLLDSEAAVSLVSEFEEPVVAIIKHNNPSGVAWGLSPEEELFSRAYQADALSAFGGIVATNRPVQASLARKLSEIFLEVVIAPEFDTQALEILKAKKNLRLIAWKSPVFHSFEVRAGLGGWLIQERDPHNVPVTFLSASGKDFGKPERLRDIQGAWKVCKHVRSNAIVIVKDQCTLGIGAGQVSRIDSLEVALSKAGQNLEGAVVASDAFFPFRDSIDRLKGLGIGAIVQPGGSQRDSEVIQACQENQIPLFFTGKRHFRH